MMLVPLQIIVTFSPFMWGGRTRPEDFEVVFALITFFVLFKEKKYSYIVAGMMIACCFFIKPSLATAPIFMSIAALAGTCGGWRLNGRRWVSESISQRIKNLMWNSLLLCFGGGLIGGCLLGWIATFDDIQGWYRQNVQWPLEYRTLFLQTRSFPESIRLCFNTLQRTQLIALLGGTFGGLIIGVKKHTWLVILLFAYIIGEIIRITWEQTGWAYLVTGLVAPMIIACSLWGLIRRPRFYPFLGWLMPMILLFLIVYTTSCYRQLEVWNTRISSHVPSPYEYMEKQMAPFYKPGEIVLATGNDYQILLHLNAPRPYPILHCHLGLVSKQERTKALDHYKEHPPK
ncbi:MAG: hypothetical protein GKR87_13940 [Kiritimatiellae bacterium]|nr:hypothetical protein [Kiritimatiellia bacterium]